jgi:hypothetical protein
MQEPPEHRRRDRHGYASQLRAGRGIQAKSIEPISRSAKFFRRDGEVEGRATNSNPLRLKVREQIEGEGLSGLVEVFHEEGIDGVCGTSYGRDRLAQGLISTRLEKSGNGEAEAHRLGDGDEDREGPLHRSGRGPQATGRGGDEHPVGGTGGLLQEPPGLGSSHPLEAYLSRAVARLKRRSTGEDKTQGQPWPHQGSARKVGRTLAGEARPQRSTKREA